jgi:tetratricopeptide (TPR) repeat protein
LKAADEALAQAQARYDDTVRARSAALVRARGNRAALFEQRGHIAETEARSKEAAEFYLSAARDTAEEDVETAARRFAMAGTALMVHGTNFFANDTLREAIRILEVEALKRYEQATPASNDRKKVLTASSALVLAQIADAQTALGGRLPGIDGARMMVDARATYGNALKRVQVDEFPGLAMDILDRRAQRDLQFGRRIVKDQGRGHFAEAVKTMRLIMSIQQGKPAFSDQLGRTRNNLANALKELSRRTEGEDGDKLIDEATALFEASAQALESLGDSSNALIARMNLGHSLGLRAGRKEGMAGIADIERAQSLFTAVAAALVQNKNPRLLAILDQHRAELLRLTGERRANRTQAIDDLRAAFESYQKVLPVLSKETAPNDWAMLCAEMGHTLVAALPLMAEADRKRSGQNAVGLFDNARPYLVAGGFGQDLERLNAGAAMARDLAGLP